MSHTETTVVTAPYRPVRIGHVGWAAGRVGASGEWLTVIGCLNGPVSGVLFDERADAERRAAQLRTRYVEHQRDGIVVRRVEWQGGPAFRIRD